MEMHKPTSLSEQIFLRLEEDIINGTYPRGATFSENSLVEKLGVSRTPIREAIHRLQEEHLIDITSKGITILGVTNEDLLDIYEIRVRIEGLAAAFCAVRASDEDLEELTEAIGLQEYYVNLHDADHIKSFDSTFHEVIYRLSGSAVLRDILIPLHKKVQRFRKVSVESDSRASESLIEHKAIYEAIMAHDPVRAEEAMLRHVKNAKAHIQKSGVIADTRDDVRKD
jgi:DNA-binding GntR family transcriptional regulator